MVDFNELITEQIAGLEYGTIQTITKVHRGAISKVETVKATSIKIDGSNPEADAAAVIISIMKQKQGSLGDSSLGFSVLYRKGKPVQVQVQDFVSQ